MQMNARARNKKRTHEGAPAHPATLNAKEQLSRSIMACMLWEGEFYEDGMSIADRITETACKVDPDDLAELAVHAREQGNLRHVPLLLLCALAKSGKGQMVGDTIARVIKRADELSELVSMYWRDGKKPLSKQMKRGLAKAFQKFDEYQLAKYNRDRAVKLRDVLFLCHAKPLNDEQAAIWKRLVDGELATPDTWETNLSAGEDKCKTFSRLLADRKLGYMALLRNLRNMDQAGVNDQLIRDAIIERKGAGNVLPFRFVAAARACPRFEPSLDKALVATIKEQPRLDGKTVVLVDVSASMNWGKVSAKSDLNRMDAAACLGSMVNAENLRVFSFSNDLVECPPRHGMAGVDTIIRSQYHGGTDMGMAVRYVNDKIPHDRLIVITDEQSHSPVPAPVARHAYMINVASYENGIGYGKWTHINGFSEQVLRFIYEFEA